MNFVVVRLQCLDSLFGNIDYQEPRLLIHLRTLAFILAALPAFNVLASPIVFNAERFHDSDYVSEREIAQHLAGELNCFRCHVPTGPEQQAIQTKQAPRLHDVRSRVKPEFLAALIADPAVNKPGTTMPSVLSGSQEERSKQATAIAHFLLSLQSDSIEQAYAPLGSRQLGQTLYETVGCLACHDQKENNAGLSHSVPHGNLGEKYTLPSLTEFLENPLHTRPSGRMPDFNLSRSEATAVAAYLLPHVPEERGISAKLYRGRWQRLPEFSEMTPVESRPTKELDAKLFGGGEHFGIRFNGQFSVQDPGAYQFHLHSDDGSKLWVDTKLIVDHDGIHGGTRKAGSVELQPGIHDFQVDYFEASGQEEVRVDVLGPKVSQRRIEKLVVYANEKPLPNLDFELDSHLALEGKRLFFEVGCNDCHQLEQKPTTQSLVTSIPTTEWRVGHGCLSTTPILDSPDFQLSDQQRQLLNANLSELAQRDEHTSIQQTMLTHNCFACHQRDGIGGILKERDSFFKTTQPEMGDEGRIPPHLDGVGAKLTAEWLDGILASGAKDRPYMLSRMPNFGRQNVGHLRPLLESHDAMDSLPKIELKASDARKAGWLMVGDKGFGCIKCHTFGRYNATGIQSIDLTITTKRLREDWFRRYVRNPPMFRRGTRMPSAWPPFGDSLLDDFYDGNSDKQIQAVWNYLSAGRRAKTPAGLVNNSQELIPGEEAIIYRNFIQGAGPRAIGVGFPEGLHLAFDAQQLRLALIWQGAFINAGRHWNGRGQGFEPPAGEKVISFANRAEFALLDAAESPWPTSKAALQFKGYRLSTDSRPSFHYSVGDYVIVDTPNPQEQGAVATLVRKLEISPSRSTNKTLFFRAATASKLPELDDNWYELDGDLRIKIKSDAKPIIVELSSGCELRIPISANHASTIIQEFSW